MMPARWQELVGLRKTRGRLNFYLLREEDPACSGLLLSLKCVRRRTPAPDEYTELLGRLSAGDGTSRFLYAVYGREGAVSEMNEDLYWRLRDRDWELFESICPAEGFLWQPA